jgi:myo-inositol-1(or 4)-monophosphatase
MEERTKIKDVLMKATYNGGEILMNYFLQKQKIWSKSPFDIVTEADKASEEIIISEIKRNYPEHSILSEEQGLIEGDKEHKWIIDPLDGTLKFVLGEPYFSISIAYEYRKKIIIAIVYQPFTKDIYIAQKGKGAFKNDVPLKVSSCGQLKQTFVCCDWGGSLYLQKQGLSYLSKLLPPQTRGVGVNFSPALDLCNLAEGNISLMISNGTTPEDHSAGSLIVKEAGGCITNFGSNNWSQHIRGIIATSNITIKKNLSQILN